MANVLHIVNSFDPAGDVSRCHTELNKYSKHKHAIMIKDIHPYQKMFQYEQPIFTGRYESEDILTAQEWADAVLFHFVGPEQGWQFPGKPAGFRNCTAYYNKVKDRFYATYDTTARDFSKFNLIGTNHLGATDFLSAVTNNVHFLPSLIPLDDPLYQPNWADRSPCVSMIKTPEKFYNAKYEGSPSRQYLYGMSHREILNARRNYASIVIDNVTDAHYGLAGLEAMALGLPVVVYNHPKTWDQLYEISSEIPPGFVEVGYDGDVSNAVNYRMNLSVKERKEIREWMDQYYCSQRLIDKFWDPFADELLEVECSH